MFIRVRTIFSLVFLVIVLSSCFSKYTTHGYPEDEIKVKELKIGSTSKEEAIEILGDPGTMSTFDPDIWYYISTKMKAVGFFRPEIIYEQVMQLNFKNNKLSEVKLTDNLTKKQIVFNKEKSLVEGDDSGVLKDFFHNFGRFNKALARQK